MGDVAVDGAAQVDAPAARAGALAAHQPRAHPPRQTLGELMGGGDIFGVGDAPGIEARKGLGARSATTTAAIISRYSAFRALAALGVIRRSHRGLSHARLLLRPQVIGGRAGGDSALAHAAALPIGLEDSIEAVPVG